MNDRFDQHTLNESVAELGKVNQEIERQEKELCDFHASDEWSALSKFDQHMIRMREVRDLKADARRLQSEVDRMESLKGDGPIATKGSPVMEAFKQWRRGDGTFKHMGSEDAAMFESSRRAEHLPHRLLQDRHCRRCLQAGYGYDRHDCGARAILRSARSTRSMH